MRVDAIMSRPVISCAPSDSLERCAQQMWEGDVGFVVVMGSDNLAGVITDRDICMAAYTRGLPLGGIRAEEVMSRNVYTIGEAESVDAAEKLMAEKQVRRLPVIDDTGRVVGVLSLGDVAREADRELDHRSPEVDSYGLSHTLGTICTPRQAMMAERPSGAV